MAILDEKGVVFACPNCGQRNRLHYEQLNHSARCGKCKNEIKVGEPVEVESQQHFDLLISRSPIPILVDFWAAWCGPCKMVAPEFEKVAASSSKELIVAKVDTDDQSSIAQRFNITSMPTLVLFKDGKEVARTSGARPAAAIKSFVQQSLTPANA